MANLCPKTSFHCAKKFLKQIRKVTRGPFLSKKHPKLCNFDETIHTNFQSSQQWLYSSIHRHMCVSLELHFFVIIFLWSEIICRNYSSIILCNVERKMNFNNEMKVKFQSMSSSDLLFHLATEEESAGRILTDYIEDACLCILVCI